MLIPQPWLGASIVSRFWILIFARSRCAYAAEDPSTVLIIVNDNTPPQAGTGSVGASQFVANYYAAARGIPTSNIVHTSTRMACCQSDPNHESSWVMTWAEFDTT